MKFIGVPEHFNLPITTAIQQFPEHEWEYVSQGTGRMLEMLEQEEADIAILLTEGYYQYSKQSSLLSPLEPYITSPLIWGIHAGSQSSWDNIPTSGEVNIAISRFLSGSHLMPLVKNITDDWGVIPKFQVVQNLDGARALLKEQADTLFFWEKYTTYPFVDNQEFKRLGEYPSPWPAFLFVCRSSEFEHIKLELKDVIHTSKSIVDEIEQTGQYNIYSKEFNMLPNLAKEWYHQTEWFGNISMKEIQKITTPLIQKIS